MKSWIYFRKRLILKTEMIQKPKELARFFGLSGLYWKEQNYWDVIFFLLFRVYRFWFKPWYRKSHMYCVGKVSLITKLSQFWWHLLKFLDIHVFEAGIKRIGFWIELTHETVNFPMKDFMAEIKLETTG